MRKCFKCESQVKVKHVCNKHICTECLKDYCFICSTKKNDLIFNEFCQGHSFTLNPKFNRFMDDKQFIDEARFEV